MLAAGDAQVIRLTHLAGRVDFHILPQDTEGHQADDSEDYSGVEAACVIGELVPHWG